MILRDINKILKKQFFRFFKFCESIPNAVEPIGQFVFWQFSAMSVTGVNFLKLLVSIKSPSYFIKKSLN